MPIILPALGLSVVYDGATVVSVVVDNRPKSESLDLHEIVRRRESEKQTTYAKRNRIFMHFSIDAPGAELFIVNT